MSQNLLIAYVYLLIFFKTVDCGLVDLYFNEETPLRKAQCSSLKAFHRSQRFVGRTVSSRFVQHRIQLSNAHENWTPLS